MNELKVAFPFQAVGGKGAKASGKLACQSSEAALKDLICNFILFFNSSN